MVERFVDRSSNIIPHLALPVFIKFVELRAQFLLLLGPLNEGQNLMEGRGCEASGGDARGGERGDERGEAEEDGAWETECEACGEAV